MQTFLPYRDFIQTAKVLDNKRLNKQKIEAYQILNCIFLGENAKGWKNHPAVRMWRGCEKYLINYALAIAEECLSRGFKDTMVPRIKFFENIFKDSLSLDWISDKLVISHRSNLIKKFPQHYQKFWPDVQVGLPYIWPK